MHADPQRPHRLGVTGQPQKPTFARPVRCGFVTHHRVHHGVLGRLIQPGVQRFERSLRDGFGWWRTVNHQTSVPP